MEIHFILSIPPSRKKPPNNNFGGLAICFSQTHDFASPPHDGFALSSLQICNVFLIISDFLKNGKRLSRARAIAFGFVIHQFMPFGASLLSRLARMNEN
jgi:hypothetical protein